MQFPMLSPIFEPMPMNAFCSTIVIEKAYRLPCRLLEGLCLLCQVPYMLF
jgi:hypothetical protein